MVLYSSYVLDGQLIVCYSNGKKFDNQMHLVTQLFTMVANPIVQTIWLAKRYD